MPPDFKRIRKVTPRPAPRGAGVSVFAPQTPEQALGVEPKTTHAPNQAPYKPGRSPVQVATTRVNRQRAASPVPRNPADPRVVQIQTHLRALGYNVSVDGVMGPETRAGLAASNRGITPNHVHHPEHARTYATLHEAKVEARHVIKNRNSFKPFYPGQKPDHFIEGPAATSGQFGVGVPTRRPVYVLPAAGPTGDETGLNAEQAAQAKRLEIENEGGLFPYVVKTGLESLVPVRSAHALVNGHAPSRGDIASDVFNGALWLTPGTVAPALRTARVVMDALREEGITANALRTIREARGAIRTASEDTQALRRAMSVAKTEQRLQGPIASPVKDQIAAAAEAAPNITKKQAQAYLTVNDLAARSVANILKTTPEHAYELIWKGAKFHDVAPTADELRAGTLAQTGREPEITNLSQVPEFHQIDSQPIQRAARNLLRTWRDAAPEHARKPKQLQGLLEDLQRRAIEAANYRHWYANSAAGILAHVNGDKSAADQLAALIAVYSPRSEVYSTSTDWNNLDRAINAFDEYHATGSISPRWSISSHLEGEGDWQTFRAQQIMEGNFEWKGLKTNRFYRNFLQHIDPEKYAQLFGSERFGTMDTWMRRAFKYPVRQKTEARETLFGREEIPTGKKDEPISPKMYAFMERATKAVADSLGWTPEEAQAAIWTSIKAETEGTPLSQAGTDFRDAFLHREARRARPLDPEQLELSPETADKPAVAAVDAAVEATRAPDDGFTLTAGLNPDNLDTGYVVAHGAWEHREDAPLTRESLLAFRNRHLDLLRSDPSMRVGGWHNPEDGKVYLDISRNFDSLDEALQFGREQGQIAIFDRGNMDVIPTGLDPEEADAIKDGLKEQGRLTERASAYDSLLQRVHETLLGQPVKSLSMAARKDAEDALFDWARKNPDAPETQMLNDLYTDAFAGRNAPDPETFFQNDNPLLEDIAVDQGKKVVKGAVERHADGEGHFLHLFRGADVSTALHELGHAVERLLPEGDRALLTEHGLDDPETFARSLERYFAEGVVPERRLRKTFRTLAEGMAEVYGHAEAIPGAKFNSEIAKAFDRFFLREGALDPQWAARVGASIFLQTDDQRALLEAAAMQHEQGGVSIEDAAKMFGLEPDALRAHIESGEHAKDQARILSNEDVGAGAAETTQNAEDYLKKWFTQEDTFPSWWKEPQDKGLQDQVFTDARDWLGDLSFLNPEDGEPMEREQFDEMSDETIQRAVEKYYDGGWHQFLSDSNYVPDTPPAEWFAQEEGFGEASKRLLDEYGALARDVARTLPEAEWPPWVRNQLRIQAVGRDEPVSTEPYPKSSGLYPPEDWFFQEEHRPRLVAFRDMRTQFPASPSRGTRAAQRAWDTASERLESVATNLRESDNALAREAGRALTPFTTRARVPKQAAKNMLHEIRRTKALRTNEIRVLHRIGRRFALLKAGEGEQLAHYYYAQLPESHRNGEGLQLVLDAQRKSRAYYEEDAAADMVADLDALQEERRALPKDAPASDVFAYLAEEGKLKQAIADIPEKIADLTTNIGKLEKVVANPPELNPDAIDAVRTLMSDRERVMFNAGLEDETADERRGLLARHLGLEPDGTEVYVGHRQGPNMPGAKFPRGASLGRSKKPGSLQRNQLALFSSGRLQQSMETIIKDWSVAQSYVFHNIAKDDLARMGEPVLGHVKPDHVLVNPKGQKIPRRLKVDPNAQAESEGFDPSDLEEYARNYMAQLPDDQKRMIEQAREFGNLHELRQVPNDVAAKYFEKLLGKKLALGTAGIRSQGGLEAVGKAVDMVNNAVYMSLIYSNPGYIPANALANLIMAGAQQGAFLPFNLLRSSQVLTHGPKRLRDLLKGEVGMGSTVALSSREGSLTQGVAHVVGGIPDNWPRIASFLHEAARAGVISKANPVLSEKDYQALIDLLTQPGKRSLLNDVSDRAVQAMVDFNRMGPTEAAVAKRLLFVWAWIRGATRYPGRFVLDHPLRSLLGIWVASGSPGAPKEVQKKIRDVLPTFSHDMPPWLDYSIEAGHEKIQGKSFPRVFPTRSISPVSTPMELGETIVGKPGAQTFAQLLNPALQSAWYMAHRQDARGNDVKSYRESVVKNLQRDVPNAALAQDLIHPPKLQDAGLYPGDTTRLGRVERASRVFPIPVDPSVALKLRESMGLQGDLAAVHRERLENEAKAAHLPPPSKDLLLALDHKTALDHITGTNRGDAQSALKDAVRYYTKTTGRHDFDRVVPAARGNDALARQMISTIRGILIGPGLSAYEDAVKTAAEARGGKP